MKTFLEEVAETIVNRYGQDMSQATLVFNNKRSGLFFKNHLSNISGPNYLLPKIIGMNDLIEEWSGLEILEHEYLLFELYAIHQAIENGKNAKRGDEDEANKANAGSVSDVITGQSFEDFISFGDMMIGDFSEIDLYRVDAQRLFNNLHDLKVIGEWDITGKVMTGRQKEYLKFYESLYGYYTQFRAKLQEQGKGYSGMAYREVAEKIDTIDTGANHYYFVGFNALSTSEIDIIHTLYKQGKGTLITDGDAYYYDDKRQEAGYFLRKHATSFNNIGNYPDHFKDGNKTIHIVSCPEEIVQAKYAGKIIESLSRTPQQSLQDTALVLADEKLIVPVLNSIPDTVKDINVTMGYPYEQTMTHSTMMRLFALYENATEKGFHYKDFVEVVFDASIAKTHRTNIQRNELTSQIRKNNYLFLDAEMVNNITHQSVSDIHFLFDEYKPTPEQFLDKIQTLIQLLKGCDDSSDNKKEKEALVTLQKLVQYYKTIQRKYHYVGNVATLKKIYQRMVRRLSLSLIGKPLAGLQVLGMLESRNLDFRRIILLSSNEGVLPSGKNTNTLIPYNLKSAFGLPTHIEKDAVYANHFYQLLQRAEEVHILYSTQSDGQGKGEASRYVRQLQSEIAKTHKNITTIEEVVAINNEPYQNDSQSGIAAVHNKTDISEEAFATDNALPHNENTDSIHKSDAIMERLAYMAGEEKGFSATSLNNYRDCPKRFYYENVLGIKDEKKLQEELDQSEFGLLVHAVLCKIYEPTERRVTAEMLEERKRGLRDLTQRTFSTMFGAKSQQGRNHINIVVAEKEIEQFLDYDIDEIKRNPGKDIIIEELEKEFNKELTITNPATIVHIIGTADRIDRHNGNLRIIDYKTGKVETSELIANGTDNTQYSDKMFQLLLYAWAHSEMADTIESSIYPLRNTKAEYLYAKWGDKSILTKEQIETFKDQLTSLIEEILSQDKDFEAKETSRSCNYCVVHTICKKSKATKWDNN